MRTDILRRIGPIADLVRQRLIKTPFIIYTYFRLALTRFYHKEGMLRASSLAYSLLFAIIPLIAAMSLFVTKIYELNRVATMSNFVARIHDLYLKKLNIFLNKDEINTIILRFLPYTTDEINSYIRAFVDNAMTIGWIGSVILFITIIVLVASLESIFNFSWEIKKGRPIYRKIGMIIYILFLFITTFSLSVKVGSLQIMQSSLFLRLPSKLISFGLLVVSFSVLYRLVPNTRVKWRAALLGGGLAAVLYGLARVGFRLYIQNAFTYNRIYGSLGLVPIFVISLFMLSFIIILGVEMSYVAQHYKVLYFGHLRTKLEKREERD